MPQPRRAYLALIIAILAIIGSATLIWATPLGINVTPDSVVYIGAARSLLAGTGLSMPSASGLPQPLTHYPPLYPLLLALSGIAGGDPLIGARWLNVCFFGANTLLVGLIIQRWSTQRWPAVAGSLLTLLSVTMLRIHAAAWSEPAALFFGFVGLFLLSTYLETGRKPLLVTSAIAVGLSLLTRYASLPYIIAGGLGILVFGKRSRRSRWSDAFAFCGVGLLPSLLWAARNLWIGVSATNRSLGLHPIQIHHIKAALTTVSTWLLPTIVPATLRVMCSLALLIALLGVYAYLRQSRPRSGTGERIFLQIVVLFGASYSLFLIAIVSFIDALLPFDQRMLSPLYIVWIFLLVHVLDVLDSVARKSILLRSAAIVMLSTFAVMFGFQTLDWTRDNRQQGDGYTTRAWQQSTIIDQINGLPTGTPIFSNGEDAVYILTDRPASSVPHVLDAINGLPDQNYAADLASMEALLRSRAGVIVYFKRFSERVWNVSADDLKTAIPLDVVYDGADGTIYRIAVPAQ